MKIRQSVPDLHGRAQYWSTRVLVHKCNRFHIFNIEYLCKLWAVEATISLQIDRIRGRTTYTGLHDENKSNSPPGMVESQLLVRESPFSAVSGQNTEKTKHRMLKHRKPKHRKPNHRMTKTPNDQNTEKYFDYLCACNFSTVYIYIVSLKLLSPMMMHYNNSFDQIMQEVIIASLLCDDPLTSECVVFSLWIQWNGKVIFMTFLSPIAQGGATFGHFRCQWFSSLVAILVPPGASDGNLFNITCPYFSAHDMFIWS